MSNFHPLEVVARELRDPQLQVGENFKWDRPVIAEFKILPTLIIPENDSR